MSSELTTNVPSAKNRNLKGRFRDTSRFFVMNELKLVRFVAEDEIRALEAFYHQDLCDLLGTEKSGVNPPKGSGVQADNSTKGVRE
jgi:hypothetical protein